MRKLFLLFATLCLVYSYSTAQEKPIKASPASITYNNPASKAAAKDPNIQEYVNPATHEVIYLSKNVCSTTGKVSYDTLEYCSKSQKFVSVAPVKEVRSSCSKSKRVFSTKVVKAPAVTTHSNLEYIKAQKAACSSAKIKVRSVKNAGNK